jgi:23S rRNA (cytosine1962-C5)-methyltransferase
MGFSSLVAENLMNDYFPNSKEINSGELFLPDQAGRKLPLSVFCRGKKLLNSEVSDEIDKLPDFK